MQLKSYSFLVALLKNPALPDWVRYNQIGETYVPKHSILHF